MPSDLAHRVRPDWKDVLKRLLVEARTAGPQTIMVFDLDSTVFDNRPRQSRIVREFGVEKGVERLTRCEPAHWTSGWDMKAAFLACGLSQEETDALFKDAKNWWVDRFFTSAYCVDDVEVPGAPEYLAGVLASGAQLVYLTGRHEEMREGTIACLAKCKMPVPNDRVKLVMKPTLRESDDSFKRIAHDDIEKRGTIFAAFDNEPTHANDYATRFPQATVVHLATDHSGRPVELLPRVISVPHFVLDA
jgi:hypothetical protein